LVRFCHLQKWNNKNGAGHVSIYALAKNYLEIAASNLFTEKMGFDHVKKERSEEWKNKGFFMRYQEIELNDKFYELLQCPRTQNSNSEKVGLTVHSSLHHVGKSSFVIDQTLHSNGEEIGNTKMQICCIDYVKRKSSKLPDSFINHQDIAVLKNVPRPSFPSKFFENQLNQLGKYPRIVQMSDLDENDHLNEAGYLKFCLDAFHMSTQFNPYAPDGAIFGAQGVFRRFSLRKLPIGPVHPP
jgi:acyl-CoA thioesterase FadM